uniref:Uncharacterized protein n=1 Tax=Oryza glaberrima TaxID=4538 RepID=I1QXS3_ORYGL
MPSLVSVLPSPLLSPTSLAVAEPHRILLAAVADVNTPSAAQVRPAEMRGEKKKKKKKKKKRERERERG